MADDTAWYSAVNEAIQQNELLQIARRGQQIQREERDSETVKYLIDAARNDQQQALQDLANTNPTDIKAVCDAQFRYHVTTAILYYIQVAKEQGDQALMQAEVEEAPDAV